MQTVLLLQGVDLSWFGTAPALYLSFILSCLYAHWAYVSFMPLLRWFFHVCPVYSSIPLAIIVSLFSIPVNICSVLKHLPRSLWKQWLLHGWYKTSSYLFSLRGVLSLAPVFVSYFHKNVRMKKVLISLVDNILTKVLLKINERQWKAIPHLPCSM